MLKYTCIINYVLGSNRAYVVANGQIDAREVKLGDRFEQDVRNSGNHRLPRSEAAGP